MRARRILHLLLVLGVLTPLVALAGPLSPEELRACQLRMAQSQPVAEGSATACDQSSGGPPPPPPPPGMFNAKLNSVWITEFENPLQRFQTLTPPADSRGGLVVALPALTHTADPGDSQGTMISVTDASIRSDVTSLGLTPRSIADMIDATLSPFPALHDVSQTAQDDVMNGAFTSAASTLMTSAPPARVRFWCGTDGDPRFVDWAIGIPATIQCGAAANAPLVPMAVEVLGVDPVHYAPYPGTNLLSDPPALNQITLALATTSTTTDSNRYAAGFAYGHWAGGAITSVNKPWNVAMNLTWMRTPDKDHLPSAVINWTNSLPSQVPGATQFKKDDSYVVTYGGKLTRGTTFRLPLAAPALQGQVTITGSQLAQDMQHFTAEADPLAGATTSYWEFVMPFSDGHSIVGRAANLLGSLDVTACAFLQTPENGNQFLVTYASEGQPLNTTLDTAEIETTFYNGPTPIATTETLAIPTTAQIMFDDGSAASESTAGVDVGTASASTGFFRTILITSHMASLNYAMTADYARHLAMFHSTGPNNFDGSANAWDLFEGSLPHDVADITWDKLIAAEVPTWRDASYVKITWPADPTVPQYSVGLSSPSQPTPFTGANGPQLPTADNHGAERWLYHTKTSVSPTGKTICPLAARAANGYCL